MILVTAGYGNTARKLIPRLVAAGARVRAVRRSPSGEEELRALGAHEVVTGDLLDPEVLERAVAGVDSVYHIGPSVHPREAEMGIAVIDAAVRAGVGHFVYSSVLHAIVSGLVQHNEKRQVEEHLVSAPIPFTILQPSDWMELNITPEPAFETGTFSVMWNVDRGQALIALDDLVEVAARVLLEGEPFHGGTFELTAPGCWTAHEIGAIIAEITQRPIAVRESGIEDRARLRLRPEHGEQGRDYNERFFAALHGWMSTHDFVGNPLVLRTLLGREPTSLRTWLERRWERYVRTGSAPALGD